MLLSTEWRKSVQDSLLERYQENNMNAPEKVKELVDKQFKEFSEPIKELIQIIENENMVRYKAYDRAMDVEYTEQKIIFYQVMFSSEGKEVERKKLIELNHNGKIFVHIIGNKQPDQYINTAKIEDILEKCFYHGIALRY